MNEFKVCCFLTDISIKGELDGGCSSIMLGKLNNIEIVTNTTLTCCSKVRQLWGCFPISRLGKWHILGGNNCLLKTQDSAKW